MTGASPGDAVGLILAPHGRDGLIAQSLLREAGARSEVCAGFVELTSRLGDETGFVLLTEEPLRGADLKPLADWVRAQPSWSDLPFVVLTQRGGGPERNPAAARLSDILGNVSFLERPFHPTTLVSLVRSALKGRRRQLDAKARLEELGEGEARLKLALEAGRLGAWELDLATRDLQASDSCRAVFGRAPSDPFTYADLLGAVHPDDRERVQAAVRATVETGVDYAIEHRDLWPDGSVHWAEVRARLVPGAGEGGRMVGVSSDITERKTAEVELLGANERLEQRVAARTAELQAAHGEAMAAVERRERAEEALRQAQKMEAVGQLTGGVAHDFNNLLTIIRSSVDYLKRPDLPPARQARYVQAISDTTERATKLTSQLLAFARRQPLKPEVFDLVARMEGLIELVRPLVGSRVLIDFAPPVFDPPLAVEADVSQFETALVNLAVNARDAMEGEGRLRFEVAVADGVPALRGGAAVAGRYAGVSVVDEGAGVPPDRLEAIFEPFFTTKEVGKGTGLGLSQVFGFAQQSGGDIEVSSAPGEGARFTLYLPLAAPRAASAPAPSFRRGEAPPSASRALCVLVVEDNEAVGQFATEMLSDLGHAAVWAGDAREALACLEAEAERFDVVFSDVVMPGMNGLDLAHELRRRSPELPVVLASGYSHALAEKGSDGFALLRKPYSLDQLSQALAGAVEVAAGLAAGRARHR